MLYLTAQAAGEPGGGFISDARPTLPGAPSLLDTLNGRLGTLLADAAAEQVMFPHTAAGSKEGRVLLQAFAGVSAGLGCM